MPQFAETISGFDLFLIVTDDIPRLLSVVASKFASRHCSASRTLLKALKYDPSLPVVSLMVRGDWRRMWLDHARMILVLSLREFLGRDVQSNNVEPTVG